MLVQCPVKKVLKELVVIHRNNMFSPFTISCSLFTVHIGEGRPFVTAGLSVSDPKSSNSDALNKLFLFPCAQTVYCNIKTILLSSVCWFFRVGGTLGDFY